MVGAIFGRLLSKKWRITKMMTRKDYVETAKILSKFKDEMDSVTFNDLVFEFSEWFLEDNPRFIQEKFEEACYEIAE